MKWINIHIILSVWVIFFAEIGYAEDQKPILDADSYISMGIDNVVKGQYKQALSDFNKALEINPNYAGAYYNRGLVNVILEQKEQAISDFSKAIEINPNDAEAYYNRGNVFGDMGNLDKAMSDYNKAIELSPENVTAYFNRGMTYWRQDNYEKAISDLNKAIEINPDDAEAYYIRGIANRSNGNYKKALDDFLKAQNLGYQVDPKFIKSTYGQQKSIDIFVDNTKINISIPSGFNSVDSSSEIWKIAETITSGETELLAVIVEKDISVLSRTDITLSKYLLVQVSKQIRDRIHSDDDFSELKNGLKKIYTDKKDNPTKLKKQDIDNRKNVPLEEYSIPIDMFYETNNSISPLFMIKQVYETDGKKEVYLTTFSPNILYIKGKLIYLYVGSEYNSEVDSEWVKNISKEWITSVIKSNKQEQ